MIAAMDDIWDKRFDMVRFLGWIALASPLCGLLATFTQDEVRVAFIVLAVGLFVPLLIYVYVVQIWHWKARYRGRHSDLWGALMLLETSGWMKLVYLFRHLIPDMRRSAAIEEAISAASLRAGKALRGLTLVWMERYDDY